MNIELYLDLKQKIIDLGYAGEIDWAENIKPVNDSKIFLQEYTWVVLNSGMKNQIARKIYNRILEAWKTGKRTQDVFKHKGKANAIEYVFRERDKLLKEYLKSEDKIEYLKTLPWIGPITCYHLAKNFGHDCCKPDRHLKRISEKYGTTPRDICEYISGKTGDRIATVDLVIWRAANLGII